MAEWSDRYEYTGANVDKYAPEEGGVYRLIFQAGNKFRPFYIGQSEDLKRRLYEHLSPNEPDQCIRNYVQNVKCSFRFIVIPSKEERDRVESEQIEEYKPECNG